MNSFIGTWLAGTIGDTTKVARIDTREATSGVGWGAQVALGYIPTLEVRLAGDSALVSTITGTWEDATETAALFNIGGTAALVPAATALATPNIFTKYEAVMVLTKGGVVARICADDVATPFWFTVQRWP